MTVFESEDQGSGVVRALVDYRLSRPIMTGLAGLCCLAMVMPSTAASADEGPVSTTSLTVINPPAPVDGTVDPGSRSSVMASLTALRSYRAVPHQWTGDENKCRAGDTSAAFKEATRNAVNWHRNMVGLPDATFDPVKNRQAQAAALMMAAADDLSHYPGRGWPCWSQEGATTARYSNLHWGSSGPEAIEHYMSDPGPNNRAVGHRALILDSRASVMGTGDTSITNVLQLIDVNYRVDERGIVAWPGPGFIPKERLPDSNRWSFQPPFVTDSYSCGIRCTGETRDPMDTSQASVNVEGPEGSVRTAVVSRGGPGREVPLVWEVPSRVRGSRSATDTAYTVTISNVLEKHDGQPDLAHSFQYRVTVIPAPRPVAKRITVKLKPKNKRSRLKVDVNPDQRSWNYKIKIQQKIRGRWKNVKVTYTNGAKDKRTISNLGMGKYRVKVPKQHRLKGKKSNVVRLRR